ncbi:MAG: hypothetical protein KFKLKKLM_00444 [Flavobacteriales bacterium]|nr:hypothetical protein [Flavobacteriales bacterium]
MKPIIFLLSLISTYSVFAQNETFAYNYFSDQGVEINITEETCSDIKYGIEKQILIIELKNNNNYPVKISFHKDSWYDNKCSSCNSNSKEFLVEEVLLPNSTIKGNCSPEKKFLTIFKKMLNLEKVKQLSKYEFKNINIEKVNQ